MLDNAPFELMRRARAAKSPVSTVQANLVAMMQTLNDIAPMKSKYRPEVRQIVLDIATAFRDARTMAAAHSALPEGRTRASGETDYEPAKDSPKAGELAPLWRACRERAEQHKKSGVHDPELEQYRWMLEEFRVSLFAQELGTAFPISRRRLDKQWEKIKS